MCAQPAFVVAHAATPAEFASDWRRPCEACLAQLGDAARGHTLGFVYVADALAADLAEITARLRAVTGVLQWVGTVGIGILAGDREYFDEPAMAVMTAALPEDRFRLLPTIAQGVGDVPRSVRDWAAAAQSRLAVVHGDPRNPNLPGLIADMVRESECYLVGGLSSSRGALDQVAGAVTRGGLSGVMFAEDVAVVTGLSQGCTPIGPQRRITGGERNLVREIDGRPALEILKEDAGELLARGPQGIGALHVALPVGGSDTGDYLVRNLVGVDPERGWLAIGDHIAAGDAIMFCRRDAAAAREDLTRMLRGLKRRAGTTPRGGLYFSCLARGPNLFGPNSAELAILRAELGAFPLVGMFCNGEISNDRLYGYTGVLALFL